MNKKILIVVDSSCTISLDDAKKHEIEILPLSINRNDGVQYTYDALKMDGVEFLNMSKEGYIFTTSCTPQGIIEETIDNKLKEYDQIIALPLCQKWSSQYSHLKALSNQDQYKNKLFVIDTNEYGFAIECLALELREKINKNIFDIQELLEFASNYHNHTICYFACKELQGLVNSGRVPKIIAKLFKLAKIMPIIRAEGENHLETIIKNFPEVINKMIKYAINRFGKLSAKDIKHIAILNSNNSSEYLNEIVLDICKTFNIDKNVISIKTAPTIFMNIVGAGSIGIHIIANKEKA